MKRLIALTFILAILVSSVTVVFATGSLLGDINGNGEIDIMDATAIQRYIAQLVTFSDEEKTKADVDGDGDISIMDCTTIQRYIAKLIDSFPAQAVKPTEPETKPTEPQTQAPSQQVTPNEYELEILRLVNIEREKEGVEPLEFGYFIYDCAKLRAKECDTVFSHYRPDGTVCFTVFEELGVKEQYSTVGENIAWGHTTAQQVVNDWMNSEGHRANILNSQYDYIAIGSYECTEQKGSYSTVQLFWG